MTIAKIQEILMSDEILTGQTLSEFGTRIAAEYSWECSQLEEILKIKPTCWNTIRDNVKSDTATERLWEQTEQGINEMGIKLRLKSLEKLLSAVRTRAQMANNDYHNQKI